MLQNVFFNGAGLFKRLLQWVLSGEHIGSPLRYMRFYLLCSFVRTFCAFCSSVLFYFGRTHRFAPTGLWYYLLCFFVRTISAPCSYVLLIFRALKLSHLMQQGGVACKARGIIPFSFTFVRTYVCALFLYLINVSGRHIGLPLRQMRYIH